jgi:hypothetical protein
MNSSVFWDITPYSPPKIIRRFDRACRLHLQDQGISETRNQRESKWNSEQPVCPNFGVFRKQEGNGRQQTSSRCLTRRTDWTASTIWLLDKSERIKNRITSCARVICSSETSVDFQRTKWRYITDDITLHSHRCENFKPYVLNLYSSFKLSHQDSYPHKVN